MVAAIERRFEVNEENTGLGLLFLLLLYYLRID